ncbi:MAG: DUF1887 family CARF protein [Candidatus Promineifilaceae bacterium]
MTTIISLIGEQNLPNLLPIRHLKPERVILVYTNFTEQTAVRLTKLIRSDAEVTRLVVDAYDIDDAKEKMTAAVAGLPPSSILVNFTGGTKMMSLAAYQTAVDLNAPLLYLQSQGNKSLLYRYMPQNGRYASPKIEEIPPLITIDDYLQAYTGRYEIVGIRGNPNEPNEKGRVFEKRIQDALHPVVDEMLVGVKLLGALEIDFIVRIGNQVGIIEAKTGTNFKKGIDQLNTAGGKTYLGTYVHKFLVSDQDWHRKSDLKQLLQARRIHLIELPGFAKNQNLDIQEQELLRETVCHQLT